MCNKHSFVMDRDGRCYNAAPVTESHSEIATIWGLDEDKCNKYEWQPPADDVTADNWTDGLTKDLINFEEKSSHVDALERYILGNFPTRAAWESYTNAEALHGREFQRYGELVILATLPQVLRAYGSATVEAYGSATVEAYGSATVRAYDSATVLKPLSCWGNNATVKDLYDLAVLIDRSVEGKVTVTKARKKSK